MERMVDRLASDERVKIPKAELMEIALGKPKVQMPGAKTIQESFHISLGNAVHSLLLTLRPSIAPSRANPPRLPDIWQQANIPK